MTASRQATDVAAVSDISDGATPTYQVQHVFNAAEKAVLKDIRDYAKTRGAYESPHGWRIFIRSQEHFVRYCCWAAIKPMLVTRSTVNQASQDAEVKPWKQDGDV